MCTHMHVFVYNLCATVSPHRSFSIHLQVSITVPGVAGGPVGTVNSKEKPSLSLREIDSKQENK